MLQDYSVSFHQEYYRCLFGTHNRDCIRNWFLKIVLCNLYSIEVLCCSAYESVPRWMAKGVYDGPIYVDVSFQSKIYCGWLQMKIEMYAVIKSSRKKTKVGDKELLSNI